MRKSGYILKRFLERDSEPFPLHPVWPTRQPSLGFVSFAKPETLFTALAPYRQAVIGIWSGDVTGLGGISVVVFNRAQTLGDAFSTVLPIQKIRDGHFASFAMEFSGKLDSSAAHISSLDLYWQGEYYKIQMGTLDAVSLAGLWSAPEISVHHGKTFRITEATYEGQPGRASGSKTSRKTARVKPAKPIKDGIQDVFSATDKALDDLHEQTKLSNIFKRAFRQRSIGRGWGKNGSAKGQGGATTGPAKGPGLAESLAGWVRWHTPLGNGMRNQMQSRMGLVEKLINRGDIDSALKLALKLGNSKSLEKMKSRFPFRLPEMRSDLDFNFSSSGFSMPILGGASHAQMWQRYVKLAEELERKGDYKRAAYIRSQLLDNHREAVLTLERGEMFSEAAKLSLDSKQDPALTIRLYYKAGKKDEALMLACRTHCFDKLAEDSRQTDYEFYTFVLGHWSQHLLDTDQPLRALEVTDDLATSTKDGKPYFALLNSRREWLARALALDMTLSAQGQLLPIELILRVILTAQWDGSDLDMGFLADFPNVVVGSQSSFHIAFGQFQDIVKGRHPDSVQPLLQGLFQRADKHQAEQAEFWKGPARQLFDRLTRSLIGHRELAWTRSDMTQLQRLVQAAELQVLALDLRKIKTLEGKPKTVPSQVTLTEAPAARSSQILHACELFNGAMIVHYDTDRFEHRDRMGKLVWAGNISDVKAIIPIGASPSVLILRSWDTAETRLTIFDTHKRQFRDIGLIHLVAWHDVISDFEWLVQVDNVVGAIDIKKLFDDEVTLEFLWSVNTTNELRILAFYHNGKSSSWLTLNQSRSRFGVMQVWRYENAQKLDELYCKFHYKAHSEAHIDWYWADSQSPYGVLKSLVAGQDSNSFVSFVQPNAQVRQEVIQHARIRVQNGYTGTDTVLVCDYHRPLVTITEQQGLNILPDKMHRKFQVRGEETIGLRLLYRGFTLKSDFDAKTKRACHVLCTDTTGRLIRINGELGRVDIF